AALSSRRVLGSALVEDPPPGADTPLRPAIPDLVERGALICLRRAASRPQWRANTGCAPVTRPCPPCPPAASAPSRRRPAVFPPSASRAPARRSGRDGSSPATPARQ